MNAIKNIAAAADEPDDKLRERMYDDIDRVIVFDNENLKIEWKFDVAFQLSWPRKSRLFAGFYAVFVL